MRVSYYLLLLVTTTLVNLQAVPQEGLVALWNFESDADNSVLGANALPDALLTGGASTTAAIDPIMGSYLELDNDGEFMNLNFDPFFQNLDNAWSAGAWFRAERAPTEGESFFVFETSNSFPISLELLDSEGNTTIARVLTNDVENLNPNLDIRIPNTVITDWNHILITYQDGDLNNTLTVYLNGLNVASTSFSNDLVTTALGFHVGTDRNAGGNWFLGDIDEVSLRNRALTPLEAGFFQEPIIVTALADENNNDGNISLREAIRDSSNGALIRFDPNVFNAQNSITLTSGELFIAQDLIIDASNIPGGVTINANQQSRVMRIRPGGNGTSTIALSNLNITGGLAPNSMVLTNTFGGGIFIDASGEDNSTQVSLDACTLFNNSANFLGGGICNSGFGGANATLTLTNCTLFGNSSAGTGGGIYNDGFAGNAILTLTNCTLSSNTALDGAGIYNDGQSLDEDLGNANLNLTSCTLTQNIASLSGGGIFSTGNLSGGTTNLVINNTIIANNDASAAPDLQELGNAATITAIGSNLISDLGGQNSLTAGASGTPGLIISDSLLSPLGDYGGPTQTILPFPGSPAINSAPASTLATDQRGFPITDGAPDIGATEAPNWSAPTPSELDSIFLADFDGDGNVHGAELLLGTDPFVQDLSSSNNFSPLQSERGVTFGRDQSFSSPYQIDVYRSFELSPDSFERVFSYDTSDHSVITSATNIDIIPTLTDPNLISLLDVTAEGSSFYQLRISRN